MTLVDRKDVRGLKREILGQFVRTVERDIAFAGMTESIPGMDPEYLRSFALNGQYWQLVAYSGGIGGCLLSIGSTAGYALMKSENVSIWWYFRHISGKVMVGWLAGLGVYFFIDSFIR